PPGSIFSIMQLADFNLAGNANFTPVDETHFDPAFVNDITAIQNDGHDIAVGIFNQPIGLAPLSYNHTALGKSYVGKTARIVGYGVTKGGDPPDTSTAGVRRQGSGKVTKLDDVGITVVGKTNDDCEGDSGGPTFLNVAGKEVIAGVTSYGDTDCTLSQGAVATNLASYSAFIDQYVNAADPPTMQGAIGATCTTNRDCASQICGSDGKADYCMQACGAGGDDSCPTGYYCGEIDDAGFCIAGTKPVSSGCDIGADGTASPSIFVGFLLLLCARQMLRKMRSGGRPYC
ncbi:MAG TPA: trypsin-like serine protease, partial [Polyangia bacterium]|nr:trypsin-like serine protease [Polyangia bacterium]